MNRFKYWFENFDLTQETPPNEKYKHIWVNDPKNPQQVSAWQRHNTQKLFTFPLAKDKFVHFTLTESVPEILRDNVIDSNPAFAVSLSFGIWLPVVQYNHIIGKRGLKTLAPAQLKNKAMKDKLMNRGWTVPDFGKDISAIIFQTNQFPSSAKAEEVIWNGPLPISNAQMISSRDAIRMLKNTPYSKKMDANNDSVKYI